MPCRPHNRRIHRKRLEPPGHKVTITAIITTTAAKATVNRAVLSSTDWPNRL
jgi:hypothetical protein